MKMRCPQLWLCVLAVALGCRPPETPDSADFGRFDGEVVASWDDDGRNMTLREDFAYIDSQARRWVAPSGSVVNGASIPAAFWTLIGGPFEGKYRNASVVHDVGCVEMTATWEDVHRMFYEACRCGGVDESKAKTLYYAVYHFGPRWEPVTETLVELRKHADGQIVEEEVSVQRVARIDPPPPTLEEVEQVQAFILEENPEPSVIKRTNRQALRLRPRRGLGRGRTEDTDPPRSPPKVVDRTAGKRPEGTVMRNGNSGNRAVDRLGRVAAGVDRTGRKIRRETPGGLRPAEQPEIPALSAVGLQERQWAEQQVRRHLEQQTGQQRPAEYDVEQTKNGYRVFVQYLQLDEQGQPTGKAGGSSTVRLSRNGKVLEMINGR
jgi:hypothetical protein